MVNPSCLLTVQSSHISSADYIRLPLLGFKIQDKMVDGCASLVIILTNQQRSTHFVLMVYLPTTKHGFTPSTSSRIIPDELLISLNLTRWALS